MPVTLSLNEIAARAAKYTAAAVLAEREKLAGSSLAELYDTERMKTMPFYKTYLKLDAAVEKVYDCRFSDDADHVSFLFVKYIELTK